MVRINASPSCATSRFCNGAAGQFLRTASVALDAMGVPDDRVGRGGTAEALQKMGGKTAL